MEERITKFYIIFIVFILFYHKMAATLKVDIK